MNAVSKVYNMIVAMRLDRNVQRVLWLTAEFVHESHVLVFTSFMLKL